VPSGLEFGVDQRIIRLHFEPASIRWDKDYPFDFRLEILEQFICQAHGPVSVVSNSTIIDLDLEHGISPYCFKIITYGFVINSTFDAARPYMYNHF